MNDVHTAAHRMSVYDTLCHSAAHFAGRPAVIHAAGRLTYAQLKSQVDALSQGLAAEGLTKGDRVAVFSQNNVDYFALYFACARLGTIAYPINWRLNTEEVGRVIERASPRLFVTDAISLPQIAPLRASYPDVTHWYCIGGAQEGFDDFASLYRPDRPLAAEVAVDGEDTLLVISTAAVDSIPRGAALTHANVLNSNLQTIAVMGLGPEDGHLMALPLFHITALGYGLVMVHCGGCNVIMEKFDGAQAVRSIEEHAVTLVASFPPVLSTLLDEAEKQGCSLESLRHATGIEQPATIERFQTTCKGLFYSGFGQSETAGFVTIQKYDEKRGTSGRSGPLSVISIRDEADDEVPVGSPGEICVRGPLVMKEYFAQPEVTAFTFRNGWHHTGDVGRLDAEGYLTYLKRKPEKELIKPGGENVYPAEVETVIQQMPAVQAVCVFGVSDERWGEAVKAVIQSQQALERDEVREFVGARIARFKRPQHVVCTAEELPRSEDGTIDREAVKERWS